jgi:hypothetical protein
MGETNGTHVTSTRGVRGMCSAMPPASLCALRRWVGRSAVRTLGRLEVTTARTSSPGWARRPQTLGPICVSVEFTTKEADCGSAG